MYTRTNKFTSKQLIFMSIKIGTKSHDCSHLMTVFMRAIFKNMLKDGITIKKNKRYIYEIE